MHVPPGFSRMPLHMMNWWRIANVDEVASPALLVYPERAEENLRRLIRPAATPAL